MKKLWWEKAGDWMMGRLLFFLKGVVVLILFIICVQFGMWKGREQGRMQADAEWQEVTEAFIGRLVRENEELKGEEAVLQKVLQIVECESSNRHEGIWGDDGRSYGVAQFQEPSFREMSAKAGLRGLDWKSRHDQIVLLKWAVENGYGENWSCY